MINQTKFTNKAVALVLTLMLIVLLVILVGEFSYTTKIDLFVASNGKDELQNHYALVSAFNYALGYINADFNLKGKDGKGGGEVDALDDVWVSPRSKPIEIKVGSSATTIRIVDESRKFNLLSLLEKNQEKRKTVKERFTKMLSLIREDWPQKPEVLTDRIINWLENKKGGQGEASESFPTKIPLYTIKELLFIQGMDKLTLLGDETNFGLADYVTIWSNGLININTASVEVLQSLSDDINKQKASNIVAYRKKEEGDDGEIFKEKKDIQKVEGFEDNKLYGKLKDLITVKSSYFSIELTAQTGKLKTKARAIVYRSSKGKINKLSWEIDE